MKATVQNLMQFFKEYTMDGFTLEEVSLNYVVAECPKSMTSYIINCINYYLQVVCETASSVKGMVVGDYKVKFQLIHRFV